MANQQILHPVHTLVLSESPPTIQRCIWQTESNQRGQETLQTFQKEDLADIMNKNEVQRALDVLDLALWKHIHLAQVRQWPTMETLKLLIRAVWAHRGGKELK